MYKIIGILFILLILAFFVKKKIVEPYANPIKYDDCSAQVDQNIISVPENISFLTDRGFSGPFFSGHADLVFKNPCILGAWLDFPNLVSARI